MLLSFRWAVEAPGVAFSFLLKTDDDAYVCSSAVLAWLHGWQAERGQAEHGRRMRERGGEQARRRRLRHALPSEASPSPPPELYGGAELVQRCIGRELIPLFDSPLGRAFRDERCVRGWRFPRPTMAGAGYLLSRSLVARAVRLAALMAPVPSAEDATVALLLHWRGEPERTGVDAWGASVRAALQGYVEASALPLPFASARLHVVPFANRRHAHAKVEKLAPMAEQMELVRRRCRNPRSLVLHKLTPGMIRECADSKARANQSCLAR